MNSHAYQVCAFNHVCHNWHRELSVKEVNRIMNEVKVLVEKKATEINYRRVYIPKRASEPLGVGNARPLGVPTKAWRVYLHMLNNLIVWSRTGREYEQHAYFPQRGVHTAWQSVFERIDSPNIYEFDLKGFFDNVSLEFMYKVLVRDYGYPRSVAAFLRKLNRSIPKLAKVDLMKEPDRDLALTADLEINPNRSDLLKDPLGGLRDFSGVWSLPAHHLLEQLEAEGLVEVVSTPSGRGWKEFGIPQGAGTSCGLSTVNLERLWNDQGLNMDMVMYADDGIVFPKSSETEPVIEDVEAGIYQNREKSK